MNNELQTTAKQMGSNIIDISDKMAENMLSWDDFFKDNPNVTKDSNVVGFKSDRSKNSNMEIIIDVNSPSNGDSILRTWIIDMKTDSNNDEYFNNIQLTFSVDPELASRLVSLHGDVNRDEIKNLLNEDSTSLQHITISDKTTGDGSSQTSGKSFDYDAKELSNNPEMITEVTQSLHNVMNSIQQSV